MKKSILFGIALIATAAITSCTKDRICVCDVTVSGLIDITTSIDTTFVNVSKADAESKCSALNYSVTDPFTSSQIDAVCNLD